MIPALAIPIPFQSCRTHCRIGGGRIEQGKRGVAAYGATQQIALGFHPCNLPAPKYLILGLGFWPKT